MKKYEGVTILFDYPQKRLNESFSGNLIHSHNLSKLLTKNVHLYGLRPSSNPIKIYDETNTKFFTNYYINIKPVSINYLIQFLFATYNYKKLDIIYSRYDCSWKQFGFYFKILTNKKWFVEVGGIPWEEKQGLIYNKILKRAYIYPLKWADKVIFYSNSIKKEFLKEIKLNETNMCIIPCGVDENIFVIKDKKKLFNEYKTDTNFIYVTFVGAIEKWQGLYILVDVAKCLSKENIIIKFMIVGDGSYLNSLKDKVNNNGVNDYFIFTGAVNQEKVVDYINMADICISPFVKERKASPIKIFEYMACGKMVISSKIPDVLDLGLDKGIIYFEPETSKSLLEIIKSLVNNKTNLHGSSEIRKLILEKYTWEHIAKNVYQEITYEKND